MRWNIIGLTIAFALTVLSCKSAEPMLVNNPDRIVFGSFGGFAGSFQEHTLTPDGSTFSKWKHGGEIVKGGNIEKPLTDQAFKVLNQLYKDGYKISDSGNLTYYIKLYNNEEQSVEWIWGGRNERADERLRIMYKTLSSYCKKNSNAPTR